MLRLSRWALALVVATSIASAQPVCLGGGDGLNLVPCNAPVTPILPIFPNYVANADWACSFQCNAPAVLPAQVVIPAPTFVDCDTAVTNAQIFVSDPASGEAGIWAGTLVAHYSRTFIDVLSNGTAVRVYRFLLNGDLRFTCLTVCSINGSCVRPAVVNTYPDYWMAGHIDYACNTSTGAYDIAVSLQHHTGALSHGADSARPLPFPAFNNVEAVYMTSPAGFNFVGGATGTGTTRGEDWRTTPLLSATCFGEGGLAAAPTSPLGSACPGGLPPAVLNWDNIVNTFGATSDFRYTISCAPGGGPAFATIEKSVPWIGSPPFIAGMGGHVIGTYSAPVGVYPENRELTHYAFPAANGLVFPPTSVASQYFFGVGMTSFSASVFSDHFAGNFSEAIDLGSLRDFPSFAKVWGKLGVIQTKRSFMRP